MEVYFQNKTPLGSGVLLFVDNLFRIITPILANFI